MSNAPDLPGSSDVANLWDSQIQNPDSGTPTGDGGGNPQGGTPTTVQAPSPDTGNPGNANPQNPQGQPPQDSPDQVIARLNGQIRTLQRQLTQQQRGSQQPANPNNAPNGQGGEEQSYTPTQFNFALNVMDGKVRGGLESMISLYDGSNPKYKDQGNLTPQQVALFRSNPLGFVKMETVMSGDEEAVLEEIEKTMNAWASSNKVAGNPGTPANTQPGGQIPQGVQVNPSPSQAPGTDPNNPQGGNQDFWSMPIEQLRSIAKQGRQ